MMDKCKILKLNLLRTLIEHFIRLFGYFIIVDDFFGQQLKHIKLYVYSLFYQHYYNTLINKCCVGNLKQYKIITNIDNINFVICFE